MALFVLHNTYSMLLVLVGGALLTCCYYLSRVECNAFVLFVIY